MTKVAGSSPQTWTVLNVTSVSFMLAHTGSSSPLQKTSSGSAELAADKQSKGTLLSFEDPIGQYPEGAKLLKGKDKSYVLAPIGHMIEERYSAYLRFN